MSRKVYRIVFVVLCLTFLISPSHCAPLTSEVIEYLKALKFVPDNYTINSGELADGRAIQAAQAELGLPATGVLDDVTEAAFREPRCGVSPGFHSALSRGRRYASIGSRWKVANLKYKISKYPERLPKMEVENALQKALQEIAAVTQVKFVAVDDQESKWHMDISFTADVHNCTSVFGSNVLAHAFPPAAGGDVHVRESSDWVKTSLSYVLAHEISHALGVDHSDDPNALMYPTVQRRTPDQPLLSGDDRQILQLLYGAP